MALLDYLHRAVEWNHLTAAEAEDAMNAILGGGADPAVLAAFLTALRMKGETSDELVGFARAMRSHCSAVEVQGPLVDTCGTGGQGPSTFNISTAAAFVAAGAGARVAKHGNRAVTSKCGSADILEAMGVKIDLTPEGMASCIREVGVGFLFAPRLHPAMRHAGPVRGALKTRTVFNLLGPLTNPARAEAQLVGALSFKAAEIMAVALASLGTRRAFVVHGQDGLDEVTTTGLTMAYEVHDGQVKKMAMKPADFGVPPATLDELRGGDAMDNLATVLGVLAGNPGPARGIVIVNAAVALIAAGLADDRMEAARMAAASIDSGAAREKARRLAEFSQTL